MAGGGATAGRSVTSRALAVLDAFSSSTPRLSLTEIADRSGTPLSTVHRLLASVQLELRQVAAPFLLDVHTATRDTVHLAVRDGLSALYVERISGRESVPVVSQVGSRLPLHATGVGKVLLAAAPDDVFERMLGSLSRETRHTIGEPARLRREIAEVRRRGFARTAEEMTLGAASVAVPVPVDRGGTTVVAAALGIVVPSSRRDTARLVPVLEVAARGIGRELARTRDFR